MKTLSIVIIVSIVTACSSSNGPKDIHVTIIENQFTQANGTHPTISIESIEFETLSFLDSNQHYRGLQYLTKSKFYFAGSKGSAGSFNFNDNAIDFGLQISNNPDSLHFRDINEVNGIPVLLNIGSPGYIKRQVSNSRWITSYQNPNPNIFMDGMDFWDNGSGLVYGDPLDGYHFILKTTDYGLNFKRLSKNILPDVLKDEAGFAASGTGVVCIGNGVAYIGYGGEKARVFKSLNYGESWKTVATPIKHGTTGKGIYCMAFKDSLNGVIAGGNWENAIGDSTVAFTNDGGETWALGKYSSGYRSGVCHLKDDVYLSVGTAGTDISFDNGATWQQVDPRPFNAIEANIYGTEVVSVGNYGSAIRILF
jgi:hypothetical protein